MTRLTDERLAELRELAEQLPCPVVYSEDVHALLHEIAVLRRALSNAQDQGFSRMSDVMHIDAARKELSHE